MLHTPEQDRAHFGRVVAQQDVWVWQEGAHLLGFAAIDADDVLTALYVEPHAHGRGIGTALLDGAKERRPKGFQFWVFQQNGNARSFYERRGCRLVRLTDGSGNEEKQPDALYEWRPTAK